MANITPKENWHGKVGISKNEISTVKYITIFALFVQFS